LKLKYKNKGKIFSLFFFLFLFFSFSSINALDIHESNNRVIGVNIVPPPGPIFNNATDYVNASEHWVTNVGTLDDVNDTQMADGQDTLSILESWLISFGNNVWCKLTGCEIAGDLNVTGDVKIDGTTYGQDFNGTEFQTLSEHGKTIQLSRIGGTVIHLTDNTLLHRTNLTITSEGGIVNATIGYINQEYDGFDIEYVVNETIYEIPDKSSVQLTKGTWVSPQTNYIYVDKDEILKASTTFPSGEISWAGIAEIANATGDKVHYYAVQDTIPSAPQFMENTYLRAWYDNPLYESGIDIDFDESNISTTDGNMRFAIDRVSYSARNVSSGTQYIWISDPVSAYSIHNTLDSVSTYQDGGAIGNNKYFNVVIFGLVEDENNEKKYYINVQDEPSTEYNSVSNAESDLEQKTNYQCPTAYARTCFRIAKVVLKRNTGAGTNEIQTLANGLTYRQLLDEDLVVLGGTSGVALGLDEVLTNNPNTNKDIISTGNAFFNNVNTTGNLTIESPSMLQTWGTTAIRLMKDQSTWVFDVASTPGMGMFINLTNGIVEIFAGAGDRLIGMDVVNSKIIIGGGQADRDQAITFDGEDNDGTMTWKEDEDYFELDSNMLFASSGGVHFRDTKTLINSTASGVLSIVADTTNISGNLNYESGNVTIWDDSLLMMRNANTSINSPSEGIMNITADEMKVSGNLSIAGELINFSAGTLYAGPIYLEGYNISADADKLFIKGDRDKNAGMSWGPWAGHTFDMGWKAGVMGSVVPYQWPGVEVIDSWAGAFAIASNDYTQIWFDYNYSGLGFWNEYTGSINRFQIIKDTDEMFWISANGSRVYSNNDGDDGLFFETKSNIPSITTDGSSDLALNSSSGDIKLWADLEFLDDLSIYQGTSEDVSITFNSSDWVFTGEVGNPNAYWNSFSYVYFDSNVTVQGNITSTNDGWCNSTQCYPLEEFLAGGGASGIWTNVSGVATYNEAINVTGNITIGNEGTLFANDTSLWYNNNSDLWNLLDRGVPTGTISEFNLASCPTGWTEVDTGASNYSTGWVSNSDWTDRHLGTTAGGNVVHNLGKPLSQLDVKVFISTDGTEANAREVASFTDVQEVSAGYYPIGLMTFAVDNNNIKVQTADYGVSLINDDGSYILVDNEAYYYKIEVSKRHKPSYGLFTISCEKQNTSTTQDDNLFTESGGSIIAPNNFTIEGNYISNGTATFSLQDLNNSGSGGGDSDVIDQDSTTSDLTNNDDSTPTEAMDLAWDSAGEYYVECHWYQTTGATDNGLQPVITYSGQSEQEAEMEYWGTSFSYTRGWSDPQTLGAYMGKGAVRSPTHLYIWVTGSGAGTIDIDFISEEQDEGDTVTMFKGANCILRELS